MGRAKGYNPSDKAVIASAKGVLRKRPEIFLRSMAHTPFHQSISHPEKDVVLRPPGLYAPRHRCSDHATSLRHPGGHPAAFPPRPPANRRRRCGQPCGFPHSSSPWHPCGLPIHVCGVPGCFRRPARGDRAAIYGPIPSLTADSLRLRCGIGVCSLPPRRGVPQAPYKLPMWSNRRRSAHPYRRLAFRRYRWCDYQVRRNECIFCTMWSTDATKREACTIITA